MGGGKWNHWGGNKESSVFKRGVAQYQAVEGFASGRGFTSSFLPNTMGLKYGSLQTWSHAESHISGDPVSSSRNVGKEAMQLSPVP